MALSFPTSPADGAQHTFLGMTYTYGATNDAWSLNATDQINNANNLGALATDPSARASGSSLQQGDFYYNTTDDALKTYDGSAWNGVGSSVSGAGVTTLGVGEYVIAGTTAAVFNNTNSDLTIGATVAGSTLVYGSANNFSNAVWQNGSIPGTDDVSLGLSGTWVARYAVTATTGVSSTSHGLALWVRIS